MFAVDLSQNHSWQLQHDDAPSHNWLFVRYFLTKNNNVIDTLASLFAKRGTVQIIPVPKL